MGGIGEGGRCSHSVTKLCRCKRLQPGPGRPPPAAELTSPSAAQPIRWPPPAPADQQSADTPGQHCNHHRNHQQTHQTGPQMPPQRARNALQVHRPQGLPSPAPQSPQGQQRGCRGERQTRRVGDPTRSRDPKTGTHQIARPKTGNAGGAAGWGRCGGWASVARAGLSHLGLVVWTAVSSNQREIRVIPNGAGGGRDALHLCC